MEQTTDLLLPLFYNLQIYLTSGLFAAHLQIQKCVNIDLSMIDRWKVDRLTSLLGVGLAFVLSQNNQTQSEISWVSM